jgi:hypothetical protein
MRMPGATLGGCIGSDATEVGTRRAEPPTTVRTTHSCTVHSAQTQTRDHRRLYTEIDNHADMDLSATYMNDDMEKRCQKRCNMLQDTRNDPASG